MDAYAPFDYGRLVTLPQELQPRRTPETDGFWEDFERLLRICGQISSFDCEVDNLQEEAPGRQAIHSQLRKAIWVDAKVALSNWLCYASAMGVDLCFPDGGKSFLEFLTNDQVRESVAGVAAEMKEDGAMLSSNLIEAMMELTANLT